MEKLRGQLKSMQEENNRLKQKLPETQREPLTAEFWEMVRKSVHSNDSDTIKQLVHEKTLDMMDKDPKFGRTVLLWASKAGSYDVVQLCINLGANLDTTDRDGKSALDMARDGAWTHVERLLLFSKINANIGDSILNSANTINKQKGVIQNVLNQLNFYVKRKKIFKDTVVDLMVGIIENKLAFSDDLLNLAWQFACADESTNPLSTNLWKSIQKTCQEVIENGTKRDWFWLQSFIVPSTIWYKNIPSFIEAKGVAPTVANDLDTLAVISSIQRVASDASDASIIGPYDDTEHVKPKAHAQEKEDNTSYLYYELLKLVDAESKTDLAELETDLNQNEEGETEEWDKLINWDLQLNKEGMVRQDMVPNGIAPQYTFDELIQQGGASADTSFNVDSHYDLNQYLPQLILVAHILDDEFQQSVCAILGIDKDTHSATIEDDEEMKLNGNGQVRYARGPVKKMDRSRAKTENDYAQETFPTSACLLDLNRCALVFDDICTLLAGLNRFANKVRHYQSGNIIGIVRVKNGFIEYNEQTQYADIKLNVLIKGARFNIVGEVQFLLQRMLDFKKKAHNLYAIQRQAEYMESSVKQILPLLTDDKKELFVAGNGGDVKSLLRVMVIHNKTDQDLLQIDEESQESILVNICALGHVKALRLLCDKSIVRRDKLITTLVYPNRYNSTPVEAGIHHGSLALAHELFSIPDLVNMYQTDDIQLYRLLTMLYRTTSHDKRVAQHVMNRLKLSTERLIKMIHFEYKADDAFKEKRFAERYVGYSIPTYVVLTGDIEAITWWSNAVGEKVFLDYIVHKPDIWNITSFEWCIIHLGKKKSKRGSMYMEVIKHFISNPLVLDALQKSIERQHRILHWIFSAFKPLAFELMVKTFHLDEQKSLLRLMQYSDKTASLSATTAAPKKKSKRRRRIEYGERLLVVLMRMNHIDLCKTIAAIIGTKAFCDLLFECNLLNTNAWEWGIMKSSVDMIGWILSIEQVKEHIMRDKEVLYRSIFWILCRYREEVFEFIKKELQITNTLVNDLAHYRPARPPRGKFNANAKEYWDKGLLAIACSTNDVVIVQQLADMLDPNAFAKEVFAPNRRNLNILEFLIQKKKFEMVEYLVKVEQIQTILKQSDESLFRVVYWMLRQYDTKIFDFVSNQLEFEAQTFVKLLNLKLTEKTPHELEGNWYRYERYNLVQASVVSSVDCMARLVSYIKEDLFVSALFDVDEKNVNAMESASHNLNKLKFIFALQPNGIGMSDVMRYRLICYSARYSNDECFDFILNELKVNDDVLSKLLLFEYSKEEFDAHKFEESDTLRRYHDKTLVSWCAMSSSKFNTKQRMFRMLKLIPSDKRLSYLIREDVNQMTPFRCIVEEHPLHLAKDILAMIDKKEDKTKLVESTLQNLNQKFKIKLKELLNL